MKKAVRSQGTAKIGRAVPWAIGESLLSALASFLTTLVAARFITPDQFGLSSIAIAIPAIVQALLITGPATSLIRTPRLDGETLDAVFFSVGSLGVVGSLLCLALGMPFAAIYGRPELFALISIQGLGCLFAGVAAVPTSILMRKLRNRTLALRTLGQKIATLVVTGGVAVAGYGAWAVVLGSLAGLAVGAAVLLVYQTRKPRFPRHFWGALPTLRLGALVGLELLAGIITPRAILLILGRIIGLDALGYLNFGIRLIDEVANILLAAVTRTALPFFTALRSRGANDHPAFSRGSHLVVGLTAPTLLGLAAITPDLVPMIFGHRWVMAVPMTQMVAVVWAAKFTRVLAPPMLLSRGSQGPQLINAWLGLAAGVLSAIILGPFGLNPAAWSYAIPTLVTIPSGIYMLSRLTGISALDQIGAVLMPILAAAVMFIGVRLFSNSLAEFSPALRVALAILAGIFLYCATLVLIDRNTVIEAKAMFSRLAERRRTSALEPD